MARPLGDVIRRGADNVLANWPLLLIRIAESVAMIVITLGIFAGAIVPLFLATVGGSITDIVRTGEVEDLLRSISPLLVVYLLLVISIVITVAVFVHAFVQGGIVGCYLEGERRAPADGAARDAFRVFTPELWWSEGQRNVWRFFWIYNVVWFGWSLLILLPLIPLVLLLVLSFESPAILVVAIVGFIAIMLFAIASAFVVFLWSQVVLIDAAKRTLAPLEAISRSREAIRGRITNIVLVGGIFFAVSMLVGTGIAGVSFFFEAAGMVPGVGFALIPVQILISLINSAVSTLFGSWMIAALAAVLHDPTPEARHAVARV